MKLAPHLPGGGWQHHHQVWLGRLTVVAALFSLMGLVGVVWPSTWQQLQERGTDLVWRLAAQDEPERRIVIVDIDDASLAQEGPWPWPMPTLTQLVRQLDQQGASLKLFDIVLPSAREGSAEFTQALRAQDATAPNLLAQVFALKNETTLHMGQPLQPIAGSVCPPAAVPAQGVLANAPGLHTRAGHITPTIDADGTVRRVPALVCYQGQAWPALPLAGLGAALDPAANALSVTVQAGQGLTQPAWWLHLPGMQGQGVGMDADGQLRVPYVRARSAWTSVSAADVLRGQVPRQLLQGAWVIVGASAFGLSDTVPTALGGAVTGTEVHAQLLAGLLDDNIPYTPRHSSALQGGFTAMVVLLLLALAGGNTLHQSRRVLALPVVGLVAAGVALAVHGVLLVAMHWYVGWVLPACASVLAGSGLGLLEHARSLHQKGRLFSNLASYMAGPVAEQIALRAPSSDIEATRSDVTILAADIRNFSAYCEARSPEDAARVLHRFYTTAGEIVAAHGGVVTEMVGDSLLAVFNGPQACSNHPAQALAAARQIWLRCSEELPNTQSFGLEPLAIGLGLESGVALVGSFGAAERRVHTVLGTTVTIALRLRGMTADLAYPILVGQGAAHHIPPRIDQPEASLKSLGVFILPGMRHSCKVFAPRQLLQPHGPLEQQNLDYLNQLAQHQAA